MHRNVYSLFIYFLLSLFTLPLMAKEATPKPRILVRAEVQADRVLLRWIPSDAKGWEQLNEYGVRLERLTISRKGEVLSVPETTTLADGLRPRETEELKALVGQYPLGAVVAQAIFGEDFEVDLGNSPIAQAIALDEVRQQRYLFSLYAADLCYPVAKAVGWGWEDRDVKADERYLYRVTPLVPGEQQIEAGAVYAVMSEPTRLVAPLALSAQFGEAGALLSWDYNTLSHLYSAYIVERSEDGEIFAPVSDLPITRMADTDKAPYAPIIHMDSIPLEKTIYYRVAGITPFGTRGAYSSIVSGMALPQLRAVPLITGAVPDSSGGGHLGWSFDESELDRITGFRILHSTNDKKYTALADLPASERSYHIQHIGRNIYYKVEAKAKQGTSTQSFASLLQPIDSIPPAVPKGLRAEIDSLGAVHLSWQPNRDEDIYGYRLYRAQAKGEEPIPLTDIAIRDTLYVDSVELRSLNGKVYYALTALDERYNQSEISPVVEALKPNVIPPATPLITKAEAQEGSNLIEWATSEDPYLAGFLVMRSEGERGTPTEIARLEDSTTRHYEDKDITPGRSYTYQLVAFSSGRLSSPPSPPTLIRAMHKDSGRTSSRLSLEALPSGIAIKWTAEGEAMLSVTLYKQDAAGKLFLYREGLPHTGELLDTEVLQGQDNVYTIIVKSKGSRPLTIKKSLQL